jgi:hypothetical protein
MACEWVKVTLRDSGKQIYVNLTNATTFENQKKGARIRFVGGEDDDIVEISETAEEILGEIGEAESPERD